MRYDVWDRYIGGNKTRGRCYVYSGHEVTYHTFHVGHVRSVARGGSDALSNLRVICACCNSSMGVQDLEEYRRSYYGGEDGGIVTGDSTARRERRDIRALRDEGGTMRAYA